MKIFFAFAAVVILLAVTPLAHSAPVCGSTCPAQCAEAGELCTGEERAGAARNVEGNELTCVQKQNVGCSIQLAWPFIQGNTCAAGFEYNVEVDGPEDCGFLGLGAIFGGSAKYCHQTEEVACSASASCPAGFTLQSTRSCTTQSSSTTELQCCEITLNPPLNPPGDTDEEDEVDPVPGGVTYVSVRPAYVVVSPNQTIQFTAVGLTAAGVEVPIRNATWRVSNNRGNVSETGLFKACPACTGTLAVAATVGPLGGNADVEIVNLADYRIEPPSASIALNALGLFVSRGRNALTGEQLNVTSTWSSTIGELRSPTESSYAYLLGSAAGSGNLTATSLGLRAVSTVTVVETAGVASTLLVHPNPINLFEGEEQQLAVFARDANGVFVALPGSLTFDLPPLTPRVAAMVSGENKVKALHSGSTTLAVRSGSLSATVPISVAACRAGTTVQCTADDDWNSEANGIGTKSCVENPTGNTWSACADQDPCDGASPARPNPVSDGIACPAFCSNPDVVDPDCSCSPGQTHSCTDAASGCWGAMSCGGDGRFSSCTPSELCLGRAGADAGGSFNGFICATTRSTPSPLSREAVASCQQFGSLEFIREIVAPGECTRTLRFTLHYDAEAGEAQDEVLVGERAGGATAYSLVDVSAEAVRLNVTESEGLGVVQTLRVGQVLRFNAEVSLASVSPAPDGESTAQAVLSFTYNSCTQNLFQQAVPR